MGSFGWNWMFRVVGPRESLIWDWVRLGGEVWNNRRPIAKVVRIVVVVAVVLFTDLTDLGIVERSRSKMFMGSASNFE